MRVWFRLSSSQYVILSIFAEEEQPERRQTNAQPAGPQEGEIVMVQIPRDALPNLSSGYSHIAASYSPSSHAAAQSAPLTASAPSSMAVQPKMAQDINAFLKVCFELYISFQLLACRAPLLVIMESESHYIRRCVPYCLICQNVHS